MFIDKWTDIELLNTMKDTYYMQVLHVLSLSLLQLSVCLVAMLPKATARNPTSASKYTICFTIALSHYSYNYKFQVSSLSSTTLALLSDNILLF